MVDWNKNFLQRQHLSLSLSLDFWACTYHRKENKNIQTCIWSKYFSLKWVSVLTVQSQKSIGLLCQERLLHDSRAAQWHNTPVTITIYIYTHIITNSSHMSLILPNYVNVLLSFFVVQSSKLNLSPIKPSLWILIINTSDLRNLAIVNYSTTQ